MRRELNNPEHRAGVEPASPHYEGGIFATRPPVPLLLVGPVGIEPTFSGLRDRRIALSATVPLGRRRCVTAPASRVGGIRTHTSRIKSPLCCHYTTTPIRIGGCVSGADEEPFSSSCPLANGCNGLVKCERLSSRIVPGDRSRTSTPYGNRTHTCGLKAHYPAVRPTGRRCSRSEGKLQ